MHSGLRYLFCSILLLSMTSIWAIPDTPASHPIGAPPALTDIPPQTEVYVHYLLNPGEPKRMTITSLTQEIATRRDANILAIWYHPTPHELIYWSAYGPPRFQQISQRQVIIKWSGNGFPRAMNNQPMLAALFPGISRIAALNQAGAGNVMKPLETTPPPPAATLPEISEMPLRILYDAPQAFWPARYPIMEDNGGLTKEITGFADIPPDGDQTIIVRQGMSLKNPFDPPRPPERAVSLVFPDADYATLQRQGTEYAHFITDADEVGRGNPFHSVRIFSERGVSPVVPLQAKTLTIAWLGVGLIRDIQLPPVSAGPGAGKVILPPWEPGPVVTATLYKEDGTPLANEALRISAGIDRASWGHRYRELLVTTDAQGSFTVRGVTPGTMSIAIAAQPQNAYMNPPPPRWTVEVPDTGLQNATLRMNNHPFVLPRVGLTQYSAPVSWWLPDAKAPKTIMTHCYDGPKDAGWVWWVDGGKGSSRLFRYTPENGINTAIPAIHPLTLYLPIKDPIRLGWIRVTLIGQEARAGITARFNYLELSPAALLNIGYMRIATVPPGIYTISAETTCGRAEGTAVVDANGGWSMLEFVK